MVRYDMQNWSLKDISHPSYNCVKFFHYVCFIWFESSRVGYLCKIHFSFVFIQPEHPQGDDSNSPPRRVRWHFQLIPKAFLEKNEWHIYSFQFMKQRSPLLLWRFSRLSKHSINIQDGLQTMHYSYDRVPIHSRKILSGCLWTHQVSTLRTTIG